MPNFLDLPRELRDHIYESIAFCRQPDVFQKLRHDNWKDGRKATNYKFEFSKNDGSKVLYSTTPFEPIGLDNLSTLRSLKGANRQIQAETLEFLHRIDKKTSYELDVALINNENLIPAWVSVPALVKHVKKLRIEIHAVSFERAQWGPWSSGNVPDYLWSFYGILERFLHVGPKGPTLRLQQKHTGFRSFFIDLFPKEKKKFSIQTLEINIVTPNPEFLVYDSDDNEGARGEALAISGRVLENFQNFFGVLLSMDIVQKNSDWNSWEYRAIPSSLLYESIGTFKLLHDGRFKKEWDLDELLRTIEISSEFQNRCWEHMYFKVFRTPARIFEYWHMQVQAERAKYGLSNATGRPNDTLR